MTMDDFPPAVPKVEQKPTRKPNLRLAGGTDINGTDTDWLLHLNRGAIFLARPRGTGAMNLQEFVLTFKNNRSYILTFRLVDKEHKEYIDPYVFSKEMELFEVLYEGDT